MSEKRRVLELLARGRIDVDEAEQLLRALEPESGRRRRDRPGDDGRPLPKYLFMVAHDAVTDEGQREVFRLKVPLSLLRAGIKFKALIPEEARRQALEKLQARGVDVDPFDLSDDQFDDFVRALGEFEMEAGDETGDFRIYLG